MQLQRLYGLITRLNWLYAMKYTKEMGIFKQWKDFDGAMFWVWLKLDTQEHCNIEQIYLVLQQTS